MNLQQTIEQFDQKFPNLQMVVGYGEENDRIDATLIVRSHLTSSIKKAVEEAYKAIEVDEVSNREAKFANDENELLSEGYTTGFNSALSLIEKKKSEFLNK